MGLFDKFSKSEESTFTYQPLTDYEAWVGILYACISADGEVGDSEIDSLSRMLVFKQKFSGIDIVPLYKNVMQAKEKIGAAALVDCCSQLIKEDEKPTLFSMAVEIVLVDGKVKDDEKKVIEYIAHKLAINPVLVDKIVEVMLIRNKGNYLLN